MEFLLENCFYVKAENEEASVALSTKNAPRFRKKFTIVSPMKKAELALQALAYVKVYINGKEITEDLFISPVSDYSKLRWFNIYDVTALLKEGENVIAVICGNGFFNEELTTPWDYDKAPWRDVPQFMLSLEVDGERVVKTDESWRCEVKNSFIIYHQFRSGEHADMRNFDSSWTDIDYDDSSWEYAKLVENEYKGIFKLCTCQPIREKERFKPVQIFKHDKGYTVDFGKNMSGYAEFKIKQKRGDTIVLTYTEEVDDKKQVKPLDDLNYFYPDADYQTDKVICSGGEDCFKPYFTYHGFRYLQIEGCESADNWEIEGIFVHQDVERKSNFRSSNDVLNYIYNAGIQSTYSNMFYMMTDCPTREKLGWGNDAQATMEQALIDFDAYEFYLKWFEDIKVAMNEEGALPAIVPTSGWGFNWGPVCDYLLYEMPLRVYQYYGEKKMLVEGLPYFKRYLTYLNKQIEANYEFNLADWMGAGNSPLIPTEFIIEIYRIKMLRVIAQTEALANGKTEETTLRDLRKYEQAFLHKYFQGKRSVLDEQTALAMMVYHKLYTDEKTVKEQLLKKVERSNFKLECGMVGVQYLYYALAECGKADYAYKMITESEPGYKTWFENGATTLWELWDGVNRCSHNHQMFSGVIAWFYKALLGIEPTVEYAGFEKIVLHPQFPDGLDFCEGYVDTVRGRIEAKWERTDKGIRYEVTIPPSIMAIFNGQEMHSGKNTFEI